MMPMSLSYVSAAVMVPETHQAAKRQEIETEEVAIGKSFDAALFRARTDRRRPRIGRQLLNGSRRLAVELRQQRP